MHRKIPKRKSKPDEPLLKTSKKGHVELTEEQLGKVSGGSTVKFKFTTTTKDKVNPYLA
jgi:hypothetical protein